MKTVFVVGNKFRDFCCNDGVITIGELGEMARTSTFDRLAYGSRLVAGQGVRDAELLSTCDLARHALAARGIDIQPMLSRSVRASRLQTHKHHIHNSIISHPARVGDNCFEAALLRDERCELMADHQTGQHIQGMILIEAARQLFLAVTEEYFIGQAMHDRYYFVINNVEVKFTGFVFPLDAMLRYEIVSADTANPARMRFETVVSVSRAMSAQPKSLSVSRHSMPARSKRRNSSKRSSCCFGFANLGRRPLLIRRGQRTPLAMRCNSRRPEKQRIALRESP